MSLAHALSPEGVGFSVGNNSLCVKAIKREHTGVPAHRDYRHLARRLRRLVDLSEMLGDLRVRIEAVNYVEMLCKFGGLHGKICRASAADYHNVDVVFHLHRVFDAVDLYAFGKDLDAFGGTACEHPAKLRIGILRDGALNAASEISVSQYANSDAHKNTSFVLKSLL